MKNLIVLIAITFLSQTIFSQKLDKSFFDQADQFFKTHVKNGRVDYSKAKNSTDLKTLISRIENADLSGTDATNNKAFYINAYNLLVINAAAKSYPIAAVTDTPGFFDRKKHKVAGQTLTLNKLEKEKLLKTTKDARLHFVLVCGAVDCPPIVNFAYRPGQLDQQLEVQTVKALNNPNFIKVNGNNVGLSKIFEWYPGDFGGNQKSIIKFINKYRDNDISSNSKISYYNYNWQLNDQTNKTSGINNASTAANAARYVVSATIPKGGVELKVFNNLYTQKTGSDGNLTDRSTFFSSTFSALYGFTNRFNAGIELRYRRVNYSGLPSTALDVFQNNEEDTNRSGVTAIGAKVRIAPFEKLENFSIQSTLTFATANDLAGSDEKPYIDWNGATFNTQLFNDFSIGNSFSIFTEVDFLLEDIGSKEDGHLNRFSTPATLIFSYFPNPKTTFYAISGFAPYYQADFDYFVQGGVGAKYQVTSNFEIELLYTAFRSKFLLDTGGQANTFNLGLRYNL